MGRSQRSLGGILLGVKEDIMQVDDWEVGEFFVAAVIQNRLDNWRWRLMTVYGPADHEKSGGFLLEIGEYCRFSVLPIIIGGDFNLIRSENDKSNGVGDRRLMNAFNCFL
jgi:hypothetical protein